MGRFEVTRHGGDHAVFGVQECVEGEVGAYHPCPLEHVEMDRVAVKKTRTNTRMDSALWVERQPVICADGLKPGHPRDQRFSPTTEPRKIVGHDPPGEYFHVGFKDPLVYQYRRPERCPTDLDELAFRKAIVGQTLHPRSDLLPEQVHHITRPVMLVRARR